MHERDIKLIDDKLAITMRTVFSILSLLVLASNVGAFVAPAGERASLVVARQIHQQQQQQVLPTTFAPPTALQVTKKPKQDKEGPSKELILRWISPMNPYMWFVYMFAFIIGADFVKHL